MRTKFKRSHASKKIGCGKPFMKVEGVSWQCKSIRGRGTGLDRRGNLNSGGIARSGDGSSSTFSVVHAKSQLATELTHTCIIAAS